MTYGPRPEGLELNEEEAYALLALCMTSPNRLDATSEKALRKLAAFCTTRHLEKSNHKRPVQCELEQAG